MWLKTANGSAWFSMTARTFPRHFCCLFKWKENRPASTNQNRKSLFRGSWLLLHSFLPPKRPLTDLAAPNLQDLFLFVALIIFLHCGAVYWSNAFARAYINTCRLQGRHLLKMPKNILFLQAMLFCAVRHCFPALLKEKRRTKRYIWIEQSFSPLLGLSIAEASKQVRKIKRLVCS